jgi:hypothetical protein
MFVAEVQPEVAARKAERSKAAGSEGSQRPARSVAIAQAIAVDQLLEPGASDRVLYWLDLYAARTRGRPATRSPDDASSRSSR